MPEPGTKTPERFEHEIYIYAAGCETTRECYCYASKGSAAQEAVFEAESETASEVIAGRPWSPVHLRGPRRTRSKETLTHSGFGLLRIRHAHNDTTSERINRPFSYMWPALLH